LAISAASSRVLPFSFTEEVVISEDDKLKEALSIKIQATNIKNIDKAITKKLNEKIAKLFPHRYITITVIPAH